MLLTITTSCLPYALPHLLSAHMVCLCIQVLKIQRLFPYTTLTVFIAETKRVHYAVRTESLCIESG